MAIDQGAGPKGSLMPTEVCSGSWMPRAACTLKAIPKTDHFRARRERERKVRYRRGSR